MLRKLGLMHTALVWICVVQIHIMMPIGCYGGNFSFFYGSMRKKNHIFAGIVSRYFSTMPPLSGTQSAHAL